MDTADSIYKMLQHKLDEIETQIIEEEEEGEKVLGKRTPLVLILSYLNKSITVILANVIYI